MDLLKFKCHNFLSFVDARRKFSQKSESTTYAWVTSKQISELDQLQKIIEVRTNTMLKICIDHVSQHPSKVVGAIATLRSHNELFY